MIMGCIWKGLVIKNNTLGIVSFLHRICVFLIFGNLSVAYRTFKLGGHAGTDFSGFSKCIYSLQTADTLI